MIHSNAGSEGRRYHHRNVVPPTIALGDPGAHTIPSAVLESPGGFAWWYVDAIDADGNGIVLIWSFGLPFLPEYLSLARKGEGQPAFMRPSLNISIYAHRKLSFYLFQEYPRDKVHWDQNGNFHFGNTRITKRGPGKLAIDIHCPVPHSSLPLHGHLNLAGPPAILPSGASPSADLEHRWTPVMGPGVLRGQLCVGDTMYPIHGAAYHDRNEGTRRLDDLGISYWSWGRLVTPKRTLIWYVCWPKRGGPQCWGVEVDQHGQTRLRTDLQVELFRPERSFFGLTTWRELRLRTSDNHLWLKARFGPRLDNGPFYARTPANISTDEGEGLGLSEWVAPSRIDRAIHRPLIRMAVHQLHRPNSPWLPLFSGPRAGRLARLLYQR